MEAYNITYQRLLDAGFSEIHDTGFQGIGIKFLTNGTIFAVLQRWEIEANVQDIIDEASLLRDRLLRKRVNAWNAYYLLCAGGDHPIDEETIYAIEREARALRKYVVRSEADIQRIPFLDINLSKESKNPLRVADNTAQQNETITYLLDYIRKKDGERRKLTQKEIESAILSMISDKEIQNEN